MRKVVRKLTMGQNLRNSLSFVRCAGKTGFVQNLLLLSAFPIAERKVSKFEVVRNYTLYYTIAKNIILTLLLENLSWGM